MAVSQYIGSRYVPLFAEPIEWSSQNTYEPLTIVLHEGNSYTSKQAVPKDVDISNENFWALTGNYNAQVELYRRETARALDVAEGAQGDIDALLPKADFSDSNTVKDTIDNVQSVLSNDIEQCKQELLNLMEAEFINPDNFEGETDYEKLNACVTYALDNSIYNILITRMYDLTGHTLYLRIPETIAYRRYFRFFGSAGGGFRKNDSGFMFDNNSNITSHGLCLMNLRIEGNHDATHASRASVINSRNIIRTLAFNCFFVSLNNVFDGTASEGRTITQTVRSIENTYIDCNAALESHTTCTDISFFGDTCEEQCNQFVKVQDASAITVRIRDCVIEGMLSNGISFVSDSRTAYMAGVTIDGCYFEGNTNEHIYIDGVIYSMTLSNNSFADAGTTNCAVYFNMNRQQRIDSLTWISNYLSGVSNYTNGVINFNGTRQDTFINFIDSKPTYDTVTQNGSLSKYFNHIPFAYTSEVSFDLETNDSGNATIVYANYNVFVPANTARANSTYLVKAYVDASNYMVTLAAFFGETPHQIKLDGTNTFYISAFNNQGTIALHTNVPNSTVHVTMIRLSAGFANA